MSKIANKYLKSKVIAQLRENDNVILEAITDLEESIKYHKEVHLYVTVTSTKYVLWGWFWSYEVTESVQLTDALYRDILNRHSEIFRQLSYAKGRASENSIRLAQYNNVSGDHVMLDDSTYREIFHRNSRERNELELRELNEKISTLLFNRIDMTDIQICYM